MGGIRITDTHMSSPNTPHTATATATGDGWQVSWLPGRTLDRNQATTAMVIANLVGTNGVPRADDPIWLHLDGWAAELNMTAPSAVMRVSETPARDSQPAPGAATAWPPFGGSRLCAHADRDGHGAHWLWPGQSCQQAETGPQPEAGPQPGGRPAAGGRDMTPRGRRTGAATGRRHQAWGGQACLLLRQF